MTDETAEITAELLRESSFDIRIKNFEKWNPGGDKHRRWVKLDVNIFKDPKVLELTPTEFQLFISIIVTRGQLGREITSTTIQWCNSVLLTTPQHIIVHMLKLSKLQLIDLSNFKRCRPRIDKNRIDKSIYPAFVNEHVQRDALNVQPERTEKGEVNANASRSRVSFDFLLLYQKYPRKVGKKRGIQKCQRVVKTKETFDLVSTAIDRYASYLLKTNPDVQFIKHFDSFMSSWEDWVDADVGQVTLTPEKPKPKYDYDSFWPKKDEKCTEKNGTEKKLNDTCLPPES